MLTRRAFLVGVTLAVIAPPDDAGAQPRGKTWRVGFLSGGATPPDGTPPQSLRKALTELGYAEQQNVVYVADGRRPSRTGCRRSPPSSWRSRRT